MQRFQDLKVWQRSHGLVLEIYQLSKDFPGSERFGITSQLRRAAVSVPTNIAEGTKRLGSQDFVRFINIAEGSLAEAEYLVMLSVDLAYLAPAAATGPLSEITEIARMLNSLRTRVEQGISVKTQSVRSGMPNPPSK
ncbi:MAG: four helix bundle protein [Terriglobia bacterium]